MALQPFNYYFVSGAGSITVNGSPPASTYHDGTALTIAVTFTDGSTSVEWIINNTSQGTTNPLSAFLMPIGGIYLRIVGTGAPIPDNRFRFFWRFANGAGIFTVNGGTPESYYAVGQSLQIQIAFVPGFTFTNFNVNNGLFIGTTNPYTFVMPSQDVDITVNSTGNYTPVNTHGLKYYSQFCDLTGQVIKLEILKKGYVGASTERKSSQVSYYFGSFGDDILEPIVGSSIRFNLIGVRDEFFEFLDGGNRFWMVRMHINAVLFWEGYIANSFITVEEIGSINQAQSFTAVDGIKSFDSIRAIESYFTRISSGFEMQKAISNSLNQTFENLRPSHVACSIYETRLDRTLGLFQQLITPDNAVYDDGEQPIFNSPGDVKLNTSLYIGEVLRRMFKPFLCRVFLWKNEFYIISIPEMNKPNYKLFKYDVYGQATTNQTIGSGLNLSCKFTDGQRTGKPVYTEFTSKLTLGTLDEAASGGLIEYSFGNEDWILLSTGSPYSGSYQLTNWLYIRARPSLAPGSYPTGTSLALIQFVGTGESYCKIWGTTSTLGLSDPAISYIEIDTYRNKNKIQVAQGVSNTLAFYIEFLCEGRLGNEPQPINQFFGVMIKVGNSYMTWDGNQIFAWSLTFTVMQFPITHKNTWDIIDIRPIEIPEDGIVTVRIYQVINSGMTADRYTVGVKDMSLKIEQNEAFTIDAIYDKFIPNDQYSLVYPEIETFIGDVRTDNSTTAIKLNIPLYSYPHSSLWSIDGVTQIRLTKVMLQEVANLFGRPNPRIIATALRDGVNPLQVVPYQNVIYDGAYWLVVAIELDFQLNTWRIELQKLENIAS